MHVLHSPYNRNVTVGRLCEVRTTQLSSALRVPFAGELIGSQNIHSCHTLKRMLRGLSSVAALLINFLNGEAQLGAYYWLRKYLSVAQYGLIFGMEGR